MMDVLKFWFNFNKKRLQILYICMIDVLKGFFNIKKIKNNGSINDWSLILIWYKKITHIYCIYNRCLKIDFKFQKIKLKILYVGMMDV